MANVQKEHGYTAVANELLEHLITDTKVNVCELKVLLFVIRKTYGYQKKQDRIALSQFVSGTGFYRANVCRAINNLVANGLLLKTGKQPVYKLVKNWELWVHTKPKLVANGLQSSSPSATKNSSPSATHKRKKENIQKKRELFIKKAKAELIKKLSIN